MNELLRYLNRHSRTLTIYDYAGTENQLQELSQWLSGYGIDVRTVATEGTRLDNVAVLDEEGTVLGACAAEEFLSRLSFERAIEDGEEPSVPEMVASLSTDVTVQPAQSVKEMVRISREFERRALREGGGELHAGFQRLSQIANSERTMEMYTTLANEGVDVRVYGYPDTTLNAVPFTVVEDDHRELEQHWFLLYDGNDDPQRKAALVSEERLDESRAASSAPSAESSEPAGVYDSAFTTDPETVDELFTLARDNYPDLLVTSE
ncbi:DICT sensory domain-containing protein [Halorientalis salina]|uniref:DICT sensory domain-containing protein n=1 Tax=Halorientalis salina TaxID=2932266 RepID=UPI0010ACB6B2|nr:DICT sensory domain-containing protein [Halorientalis salina]